MGETLYWWNLPYILVIVILKDCEAQLLILDNLVLCNLYSIHYLLTRSSQTSSICSLWTVFSEPVLISTQMSMWRTLSSRLSTGGPPNLISFIDSLSLSSRRRGHIKGGTTLPSSLHFIVVCMFEWLCPTLIIWFVFCFSDLPCLPTKRKELVFLTTSSCLTSSLSKLLL